MMAGRDEIDRIVDGLSEPMREALLQPLEYYRLRSTDERPTPHFGQRARVVTIRALTRRGLCSGVLAASPLGLAVRARLQGGGA